MEQTQEWLIEYLLIVNGMLEENDLPSQKSLSKVMRSFPNVSRVRCIYGGKFFSKSF